MGNTLKLLKIDIQLDFEQFNVSTLSSYIYDVKEIESIETSIVYTNAGIFLVISNFVDDTDIPHTLDISLLEDEYTILRTYTDVTRNSAIQLGLNTYEDKDIFKIVTTDALNRSKTFYYPDIDVGILHISNITYSIDMQQLVYKISFLINKLIYKDDSSHGIDFMIDGLRVLVVQHNRTSSHYTVDNLVVSGHGLHTISAVITNWNTSQNVTKELGSIFIPEHIF